MDIETEEHRKELIEERNTFSEVFQYGGGSFFYLKGASHDIMRECFAKAKKDKLFSRNDFSNECGWFFMLLYGYPLTLVDKNDYYAGDCFLADSFPCNKEYAIDLCAFRKAVKWAEGNYGKGWRDEADSDTYDCILQMMAFGKVIYG